MKSFEQLNSHLKTGNVYRREMLLPYSKAVDRDLATLVEIGALEKVATGLYYKPKMSRFGKLPPNDHDLVKAFLRDKHFILFSWSEYNSLGLGLTQVYNRLVVYNYKRHGLFTLGNKTFDFRHPARGFPEKITREYLLVDLVNNLKELDEDTFGVMLRIKKQMHRYDLNKVVKLANRFGKIATIKFFKELTD